jgi:predicted metal-dependent hydrolase
MELLFRGERVRLELGLNGEAGTIRFGDQVVRVKDPAANLRNEVELHLRRLATRELPARVGELARLHQIQFKRVSVRNQRSRWGSCSRRGTISLNWRLMQTPAFVTDYIILHELAHVKEMNHSKRFWSEVARLCPDFDRAEKWLKERRISLD